jgi:hypothetical protein
MPSLELRIITVNMFVTVFVDAGGGLNLAAFLNYDGK